VLVSFVCTVKRTQHKHPGPRRNHLFIFLFSLCTSSALVSVSCLSCLCLYL
jgi:hypothetical protein